MSRPKPSPASSGRAAWPLLVALAHGTLRDGDRRAWEAALTLGGGSLFDGPHELRVTVGGVARSYSWSGKGSWSTRLAFPAGGPDALVELLPGAAVDGVHLDGVSWELPVRLERMIHFVPPHIEKVRAKVSEVILAASACRMASACSSLVTTFS